MQLAPSPKLQSVSLREFGYAISGGLNIRR